MTVERLRNNIRIILHDPEVRKQIAVEERVRQYKHTLSILEKKLHDARKTSERLIINKIKEHEQ